MLSDKEVFDWFKDCKADANNMFNSSEGDSFMSQIKEDYMFYNGYQYDDASKGRLLDEGRPALVNNVSAPLIDALVGTEIQSRKAATYYPTGPLRDQFYADFMNNVSRYARNRGNIEFEDSKAFKDTLICGLGCTNSYMDYRLSELGEFCTIRISPLRMRWDPDSTRVNLLDSAWIYHEKKYRRMADIKSDFPDVKDIDKKIMYGENDMGNPLNNGISYERLSYSDPNTNQGIRKNANLSVYEFQYYKDEPYYKSENPFTDPQLAQIVVSNPELMQKMSTELGDQFTQAVLMMTEKEKNFFQKVTSKLGKILNININGQVIRVTQRKYYKAFITSEVLEHGENAIQNGFSYKFITGKKDEKDNCFYGLMRAIKDPQSVINKTYNMIIESLAAQSKAGLLVEKGATDDLDQLRADWARADSIIEVNDLNGIKEKPLPQMPNGIMEMFSTTMGIIQQVGLVNKSLMGQADTNIRTAAQQTQRSQQGATLVTEFFDAKSLYSKEWGSAFVEFTRKYLVNDQRFIRLDENYNKQIVPLLKDNLSSQYEVEVEEAPISTNQKQEIWQNMMDVIRSLGPADPQIASMLVSAALKYAPFPASIANSLNQQLQAAQQPNPMQQQSQQLNLAQQQADINKTNALAENSKARAAKVMQDTQGKAIDNSSKEKDSQIKDLLNLHALKTAAVGDFGGNQYNFQQAGSI